MIDVKLVSKAKEVSQVISAIDLSWRNYVEDLKENIFTLPFRGNYSFITEDSMVLVEGYCGPLLIDKLYHNHKTYLLKYAISHDPCRIYGMYDNKGRFDCFVARPEIGFHFMGMNNHGHSICTGDIEFTPPSSLDSVKEVAERIIQSFRVINLESLGSVILPANHERLRAIIDNRDEGMGRRVEKLMSEELIEPIL
jgi:hypothetical protein